MAGLGQDHVLASVQGPKIDQTQVGETLQTGFEITRPQCITAPWLSQGDELHTPRHAQAPATQDTHDGEIGAQRVLFYRFIAQSRIAVPLMGAQRRFAIHDAFARLGRRPGTRLAARVRRGARGRRLSRELPALRTRLSTGGWMREGLAAAEFEDQRVGVPS